jgi:predicted DNA-binding transcriptional regulator AlpA
MKNTTKTAKRAGGNGTGKVMLSAEELAEMLGVSSRHIWALRSAGKIPAPIRLGRCVK